MIVLKSQDKVYAFYGCFYIDSRSLFMSKKQKLISAAIFAVLIILILSGIFLIKPPEGDTEQISAVMRDAVLHENEKIRLFGII